MKTLKKYTGYWLGKKRPPFSKKWIEKIIKNRKWYKHSIETKKKIGLSNKRYFDKHPERAKLLSQKQKEAWLKNPNRRLNKNGLKLGWKLAKLRRKQINKKICPVCNKIFQRRGQRKISIICCSKKCAGIAISGKNHHWWKNGKSREPYPLEWRDSLKKSIRERDNYICQICGKYGQFVHHIDYIKNNLNPKNLIILCSSCHSKTNIYRKKWRLYFEKRIFKS